MNKYGVRIEK